MAKLSLEIENALALPKSSNLTIGNLIDRLSISGHMFPITFLSLPFLTPIPIPGISSVCGIIIIVLGASMFLGVDPWIPQKILKQPISQKTVTKFLSALSKIIKLFERFFKPRLLTISDHSLNYQFNGLVITSCGLILMLPLPPGTNLPPALNILILAIGDIEDDGLLILIGYLIFILNVVLLIAMLIFGSQLAQSLYKWLEQLFL